MKLLKENPAGAVYHESEYLIREKMTIENFYDKDFNLIDSGYCRISFYKTLRRIVKEKNKDDIIYSCYDLIDLKNGFYEVVRNEDTSELLNAMCEGFKPKKY